MIFVVIVCALDVSAAGAQASAVRTCRMSDLRASDGLRITAVSEQNPVGVRLTNTSPSACALRGYPRPAFLDSHGRSLRFIVKDAGNTMVTAEAPSVVRLAPGGVAYVMVGSMSCDLREGPHPLGVTLELALPSRSKSRAIAVAMWSTTRFCGRGPGGFLYVSPFESTLRATEAP
jgi:hypothetical protein